MQGTIVGVLRGGPSREHEVSLETGASMLASLPTDRYTVRDIYIDRAGAWHDRGRPTTPVRALQGIDVALIGLHGEYGEDGEVQRLLTQLGVPYTGSDAMGSYLAMHKYLAKDRARKLGIRVPRDFYVEKVEDAARVVKEAASTFMQPMVVKPVRWGSSVGVSILHGFAPAYEATVKLFTDGASAVIIEEYIRGREASVGVVENMRGETLYKLPPIEIIPGEEEKFFTYKAKYSGATREICPGLFPRKVNEELMDVAGRMHEALGLSHYSRSDFIISPKGVYYLETNNLPAMTGESLFPRPLAAVGITYKDFLIHLIDLALAR